MNSSQETCLLCLSTNKNTINFYSKTGEDLNIVSILSTHFWFQLDEIKVLSQNICFECWEKIESFHEYYQSIRTAHKKFETVFVKIENDLDLEDGGEIYQPLQVTHDNFVAEFLTIENNQDAEDDESSSDASVFEIPTTNSIDTEVRAFDALPKTSQERYLRKYEKFMVWKTGQNIQEECFSEAVMLEYFHYLKSKYKSPTLWVEFAMLKGTIKKKADIDISYPEVLSLLRNNSVGYRPLQSNSFEPDEIQQFFSEAEDMEFLAVKVAMIFLIHGVNYHALTNIEMNDVSEQGSAFVIKFLDTKTNEIRSFTVNNEYAACVKKYIELRPENVRHDRFFLNYKNGKCTVQPIGINKFLKVPKTIATFLKLKDIASYTCHSFRRKKRKAAVVTSTNSMDTSNVANGICDDAKVFDLLPEKTRDKYIRVYDKFMAWKIDEKIDTDCFSEAVMLKYFNCLIPKYKSPTLWVEYSMLKATIQRRHSCDIAYPKLRSLLKETSFGYLPHKSLLFQELEMRRFFCEAEDNEFLAVKVIMIFGIFGITRGETLTKVDVSDVSEQGSVFVIKVPETIPDPKTNANRSFTVENEYADCVRKYIERRPENIPHSRFFINYHNGRCTVQPIGRNKFLKTPKVIANFLNLKDAESYTLDSFRKKTKTKMSKRKLNALRSSSRLLESYIEECIPKKRKIADLDSVDTSTVAIVSSIPTTNKISKDVKPIALDLLPERSGDKYVRSYENFMVWKTNEEVDEECFSEAVMLEYFNYLKTKYLPSSLFSQFSMLRTTIQKNYKIDVLYPRIKSLLKESKVGFQSNSLKSNAFRPVDIQRFLSEADDNTFLCVKVIMIFGIYGQAHVDELTNVEVKDVIEQGSVFVIKIPDKKKNVIRSFTVENEYAAYVQKYKNLRPKHIRHRRFLINYQNGKCTVQPIGRNKFMYTPKVIANFLNLEDADNYTGNSFRRTYKKLFADGGAKRPGGSSSSSVVDTYTEESIANNTKNVDLLSEQVNFKRSTIQNTSTSTITSSMNTSTVPITFQTSHVQPHQFQPYQLLPYGTSTRANDYVQPDNGMSEKILWGMQFNNFHNL